VNARLDIPAFLVATAVVAIVVGRAATAPAPKAPRAATPTERASFATVVVGQEPEWREKAANDFPADAWSQRDAFHGHESAMVREMARGAGVSIEEVFRAIDDDIHRSRGGDRNAEVVPCHPRPIFD
jgi:hypothetical protein